MRKRRCSLVCGTLLFALALAAVPVAAEQPLGGLGPPRGELPANHRTVAVHPVDLSVQRPVGDGCRYSGTIQGQIRRMWAPDQAARDSRYLLPDLRVQVELGCANGVTSRTEMRDVHRPLVHEADLERLIEHRATVAVVQGGRRCTYEPDLVLQRGTLSVHTVSATCERHPDLR